MKSNQKHRREGLALPSVFMGALPSAFLVGGVLFTAGVPAGWALLVGAVIGYFGMRTLLNRM